MDVPQETVHMAESFVNKYDFIYKYEIDARGYEMIVMDEWALEDVDFYWAQMNLEQALLSYPNQYNDSLPTYYNNFKLKFNQCVEALSPPEPASPGEYDPDQFDITLDMSPGCMSNLELTENQLRQASWEEK